MAEPGYARVTTPLGPAWYAYTAAGVVMLSVDHAERAFVGEAAALLGVTPRRHDPARAFVRAVERAIVRGDGTMVDLRAQPPFRRRVYEATAAVGYGSTATYGDVAHMVGAPRAHRAVGTALAQSPIAFMIPAHRIVRSDGTIGGYGGGGAERKRWLLAREGVAF